MSIVVGLTRVRRGLMSKTSTSPQACPVCDSNSVETNVYGLSGICEECGFVLDKQGQIDVPQWAVNGSNETQTGPEGWLEFSTVTNGTEQQLAEAYGIIEQIATVFPVPIQLRKETATVYATAFRNKATDGRDTKNMVAACLRIGSRRVEHAVPQNRLIDLDDVSSSAFRKCVSAVCSETEQDLSPVKPTDYLWFLEELLDLEETEITATTNTLEVVEETNQIVGKDPSGVAAAGVYTTVDSVTQKQAANAVGVSTETIRLRTADFGGINSDS